MQDQLADVVSLLVVPAIATSPGIQDGHLGNCQGHFQYGKHRANNAIRCRQCHAQVRLYGSQEFGDAGVGLFIARSLALRQAAFLASLGRCRPFV